MRMVRNTKRAFRALLAFAALSIPAAAQATRFYFTGILTSSAQISPSFFTSVQTTTSGWFDINSSNVLTGANVTTAAVTVDNSFSAKTYTSGNYYFGTSFSEVQLFDGTGSVLDFDFAVPLDPSLVNFNTTSGSECQGSSAACGAGVGFAERRTLTSGSATVPEPASWLMMITGFGFVGGAMRRRRFAQA